MFNKLEKLSAGLLCAALLAGCQSTGQVQAVQDQAVVLNSKNPVLQLAAAAPYTLLRLKSGNQLGLAAVMTGPRYRSASGRVCKPVLNRHRIPVGQVVCNKGKNSWYVQRALSLQNGMSSLDSESVIAASDIKPIIAANYSSAISVKPSQAKEHTQLAIAPAVAQASMQIMPSDSSMLMSLEENETLWSFALRVTGDGQNWKTIADDNGIEDVTNMGKDIQLKVASQLIQP